ncbi:MAG: cadherin-like domain-containing protein [Clostridia bacterium]|nr:cadherin-like domain-containing protein [Clostridia bacterium]
MKKLLICFLLLLTVSALGLNALAQGYGLSPAIGVLKNSTVMQKCGVKNTAVTFAKGDFEMAAGKEITYIVITSLPSENAGVLTLHGENVVEGQTIPASSISYLTFTPKTENLASTSFSFRAGASDWTETDIPCIITMKSSVNVAPIASDEEIKTVANIPVFHTLGIADPNGDEMHISISTYPKNGSISVNADGNVKYTPEEGYTGKDSFSYTVSDKFGLVSEEATVTVKVEKNSKNILFADMTDSDAYACAVMMSQSDVMTYERRDGEYYFSPTEKVTRIDYLVMLITALGMEKEAVACEDTLFDDDDILTAAAKGYLALALREEIITLGNGKFAPTDNITRGEAEQMTVSALNAAGYGGIISSGENAEDELTKADVAKLLTKAMGNK